MLDQAHKPFGRPTTAVIVGALTLGVVAVPTSEATSSGVAAQAVKAPSAPPLSKFEAAYIDYALGHCPHNRRPDRAILTELIAIEKEAGFPDAARGLLLAAACRESGFRAHPGYGDNGMSAGMFQFAPWAKKRIRKYRSPGYRGDARLDWRAAARFWARHVVKQVPKVKAYCKGQRGYRSRAAMVWASANTSAVRAPRCLTRRVDGRCTKWAPRCARRGRRSETLHWKTRQKWVRAVDESLRAAADPTQAQGPERGSGR